MPGWSTPTKGVRRFDDLPEAARRYIARLEEVSGVPAAIVSTGSERDDTILRDDVMKSRGLASMTCAAGRTRPTTPWSASMNSMPAR